ncbi:DNA helicase, partial [Tanacetum coccineum]
DLRIEVVVGVSEQELRVVDFMRLASIVDKRWALFDVAANDLDTFFAIMEEVPNEEIRQQQKGKMVMTESKITNISDLNTSHNNNVIEAIGTPIQANMDLKDVEYFHQLLQLQKLEEISNIGFSEHYFNFAAYNELSDRATARNPVLTSTTWHHNRIHSLEMAQNFNVPEYDSMEKPVIIAVSSCYINRYNGDITTFTTGPILYINTNEAKYGLKRVQLHDDFFLFQFNNKDCMDKVLEDGPWLIRTVPLILNVWSPNTDSESDLSRKLPSLLSAHNDVAIVNDGTTTTPITWFSDQANILTKDVNEVVAELTNKDPYRLPPSLVKLEGTTHTFQFHFDTMVTARRPDFVLDKVFKNPILALPPPLPAKAPAPQMLPEPHQTSPYSLTTPEAKQVSPERKNEEQNKLMDPEQPTPSKYPKPETSTLATSE